MIFDCFFQGLNVPLQPPSLLALLEMMVNQSGSLKTSELVEKASSLIFDFNYPLSKEVTKSVFENQILSHFLTRRIGYETYTLWKINLENKLNDIMPKYNLMFNAISDWSIFDGEQIDRTQHIADSGSVNDNGKSSNTTNTKSTSTGSNNNTEVTDNRFSDTPQQHLQNVQAGNLVSAYTYNTVTDNSSSTAKADTEITSNSTNENGRSTTNDNNLDEHVIHKYNTSDNLINFQKEYNNIMTMIYSELECLFYQLV